MKLMPKANRIISVVPFSKIGWPLAETVFGRQKQMNCAAHAPFNGTNVGLGEELITIEDEKAAVNMDHLVSKGKMKESQLCRTDDGYTLNARGEQQHQDFASRIKH